MVWGPRWGPERGSQRQRSDGPVGDSRSIPGPAAGGVTGTDPLPSTKGRERPSFLRDKAMSAVAGTEPLG